jgi:hypothetical protein
VTPVLLGSAEHVTEIADAIVSDLAVLISSARRQNQSVRCWVA